MEERWQHAGAGLKGVFDLATAFGVSGDETLIASSLFIYGVGQDTASFWSVDGTVYGLRALLVAEGIDLTRWSLNAITKVSSNGLYLTRRETNPGGWLEPFLVRILSPGSALTLLVGMAAIGRRRV